MEQCAVVAQSAAGDTKDLSACEGIGTAKEGQERALLQVQWTCLRPTDQNLDQASRNDSECDVPKRMFLDVDEERVHRSEIPMDIPHDRGITAQASNRSGRTLGESLDLLKLGA